MRYSISRVFTQLRVHWKTYLVFILEFAIGVAILTSSFNILLTSKEVLQAQKNSIAGQSITVTCLTDLDYQPLPDEPFPITFQDYLHMRQKYGRELNFSYTAYVHNLLFLKNEEFIFGKSTQFIQPCCFFMDDAMFQELFGYSREPGKAYAGGEALAGLNFASANPEKVSPNDQEMNLDWLSVKSGGTVQISGRDSFQLTELKNPKNLVGLEFGGLYTSKEDSIAIERCVIFPAEAVELLHNVPVDNKHSILRMKYKDGQFEVNVIPSLLSDLSQGHPHYHFTVADKFLTMEKSMDEMNTDSVLLLWVSAAIMAIVMIGMIGILLIFLYRRKKSMAIAIAFGSTFTRLALELLLETVIVFELGSVLGLTAAYFITPLTNGLYANTAFHPVCVWWILGIAAIAAIIASAAGLIGNKKLSPIQILRNL